MARYDNAKPWSPENFYWQPPVHDQNAKRDRNGYARAWRAKNVAKVKDADLRRRFGISLDDYHALLDNQGGGCAICGNVDPYFKHMAVDHCHDTGKVRGILCCACNRALGGFKDDLNLLQRAISYLASR